MNYSLVTIQTAHGTIYQVRDEAGFVVYDTMGKRNAEDFLRIANTPVARLPGKVTP